MPSIAFHPQTSPVIIIKSSFDWALRDGQSDARHSPILSAGSSSVTVTLAWRCVRTRVRWCVGAPNSSVVLFELNH